MVSRLRFLTLLMPFAVKTLEPMGEETVVFSQDGVVLDVVGVIGLDLDGAGQAVR